MLAWIRTEGHQLHVFCGAMVRRQELKVRTLPTYLAVALPLAKSMMAWSSPDFHGPGVQFGGKARLCVYCSDEAPNSPGFPSSTFMDGIGMDVLGGALLSY